VRDEEIHEEGIHTLFLPVGVEQGAKSGERRAGSEERRA
jgi:hypothetical protein